jgi:hypothetical protein
MSRRLPAGKPRRIACDPSRHGKAETVIVEMAGPKITILDAMRGKDDVVAIVDRLCYYARNDRSLPLLVDGGGPGGGAVDGLKDRGMRVYEVLGAERPRLPRYRNTRTELYFALAARLKDLSLPNDRRLKEQLMAVRYYTVNDRASIEPKEKLRAMGIDSDRADAVALLMYDCPAINWNLTDPWPDKKDADMTNAEHIEDFRRRCHLNKIVRP